MWKLNDAAVHWCISTKKDGVTFQKHIIKNDIQSAPLLFSFWLTNQPRHAPIQTLLALDPVPIIRKHGEKPMFFSLKVDFHYLRMEDKENIREWLHYKLNPLFMIITILSLIADLLHGACQSSGRSSWI